MENCYVYENQVIKEFICVINKEIKKLYVDSFFQGSGIRSELITFAKQTLCANCIWVLERNIRAIQFYNEHVFFDSYQKKLEEGTSEYIIQLINN